MDEIKFDLQTGDEVIINAEKVHANGVEYNVNGGVFEHNTTNELIQVNNKMSVKNGGNITNIVEDGVLKQKDNTMTAESEGEIINKASKSIKGVVNQGLKTVGSVAKAVSSIFGKN